MRTGAQLLTLVAAFCAAPPARADLLELPPSSLQISLTTEGVTSVYDVPVDPDGVGYRVGAGSPFVIDTAEALVSVSGYMNPDPLLSVQITVVDIGQPSQFMIGAPLIPTLLLAPSIAGPSLVRASLSGSLTAAGGNGVTFTPVGGTSAMVSTLLDGVLEQNMGVDVGSAFSTGIVPNGIYTYPTEQAGFGAPTSISGPTTGAWDGLRVTMNFGLSGGGDGASFSIFSEITPVPAPATDLLLALGTLAGALSSRRRRPQLFGFERIRSSMRFA